MKGKSTHQRKKVTQPSPDLFTRRLTSILMVQAGILPRSSLGLDSHSLRGGQKHHYANT